MDSVNSATASQNHQQNQQLHQQQFCLRWHNHQTSLLSSLPLLLDQSHLTDVTLTAEGKTLRAHRVVLSACSTFFSELFRNLETNFYPVIVIPGASFTAVVALLTFMYSGEVNVYEEQIPALLALAETLGIKGLADFQSYNNSKQTKSGAHSLKETEIPLSSSTKIPSPLENFLMNSFQFYPNILGQPLNFSQSALNKTTEFLSKCQQQFSSIQLSKESDDKLIAERSSTKRVLSGEYKNKDSLKRIDKIAENLRATSNKPNLDTLTTKLPINVAHSLSPSILKSSSFSSLPQHFLSNEEINKINEGLGFVDQHKEQQSVAFHSPENLSAVDFQATEKPLINPQQQKPSNSKLYATCFICHKQLSNQYNLRVHLETHQNVRYACNVCSHVSRSKDALRKHVSYRHPGVPSPCENEARRKRSKGLNSNQNIPFNLIKVEGNNNLETIASNNNSKTNQPFMFHQNQYNIASVSSSSIPTGLTTSITTSNSSTIISNSLNNLKSTTPSSQSPPIETTTLTATSQTSLTTSILDEPICNEATNSANVSINMKKESANSD